MKRVLLYGAIGGALIALLKVIEYKHFIHAYPSELYGGLVAVLFASLGIYVGLRSARAKEVIVEVPVPVAMPVAMEKPFAPRDESLKELGITPREFEILGLIAEGLSNREIAERLFVSENTVKTHSSRLFDKLSVNRRVQAVQRGRELGLIR
ncbi:MAG TPA: response regulator transcription factor [Thermoanaerobaculia bacterium]|nr:response regulator transcription factor [Thermoanaerobaculia bacterium]